MNYKKVVYLGLAMASAIILAMFLSSGSFRSISTIYPWLVAGDFIVSAAASFLLARYLKVDKIKTALSVGLIFAVTRFTLGRVSSLILFGATLNINYLLRIFLAPPYSAELVIFFLIFIMPIFCVRSFAKNISLKYKIPLLAFLVYTIPIIYLGLQIDDYFVLAFPSWPFLVGCAENCGEFKMIVATLINGVILAAIVALIRSFFSRGGKGEGVVEQ